MKWTCLLGGLIGCCISGYFLANKTSPNAVTSVTPKIHDTSAGIVKIGV